MRFLLIDSPGILPYMTGSGNRLIRWSLVAGLRECGCEVGMVVFDTKADRQDHMVMLEQARQVLSQVDCSLWYFRRDSISKGQQEVGRIAEGFKPDVVCLYGVEPIQISSLLPSTIKRVVMSIDLQYLPDIYRGLYLLRYHERKNKLPILKYFVQRLIMAWRLRKDILESYNKVDRVINHAANHANWLRDRLKVSCLYVPNPVMPLANPPSEGIKAQRPPKFILLGGVGGIATLSGLYYFANAVLPHLRKPISKGTIEVHLIGKGELEPKLEKKFRMAGILQRGFVEDLGEELNSTWALLVPTPIRLGFRTRILDAFRHRLCVIAHDANAAGFLELQHGKNCLLAQSGSEFASQILEIATDEALRNRLSEQAYLDFETNLSAPVVCKKIITFIQNENV